MEYNIWLHLLYVFYFAQPSINQLFVLIFKKHNIALFYVNRFYLTFCLNNNSFFKNKNLKISNEFFNSSFMSEYYLLVIVLKQFSPDNNLVYKEKNVLWECELTLLCLFECLHWRNCLQTLIKCYCLLYYFNDS